MNFGALIIGDEILSGRRQDKHLPKIIALLNERGLRLSWARYVGDDRPLLIETLKQTFETGDAVFSFGGIGATPDDHTRQTAAAALGVALKLHPDAEAEIRARFDGMANVDARVSAHRLEMGNFPVGSQIIPNPYNRIPGFSIQNHFFLPGFPEMSWPMAEWVLDTYFQDQHFREDYVEAAILVWEAHESQLVDLMEHVTSEMEGAQIFSLPILSDGTRKHAIELGAKGSQQAVLEAMSFFKTHITQRGFVWEEKNEFSQ